MASQGLWHFWIALGGYILIAVLVPRILAARRDSGATLAWLMGVVFLPYVGAAAYLMLGTPKIKQRRRRRAAAEAQVHIQLAQHKLKLAPFAYDPSCVHSEQRDLLRLSSQVTRAAALGGNGVELLLSGAETTAALEEAIRSARDHVHLEYFLFRADETGRHMLELLCERARAGIEVRLLVDGVGSWGLRSAALGPLRAAGGRVAKFLPLRPGQLPFYNFRNHRKIAIVDGRMALTGGRNIGDEYSGRLADWRDSHLRLRGPAVLKLQEVFAADWAFSTGEALGDARYFPAPTQGGSAIVQVVPSGPDESAESVHRIFFCAINSARQRVWLESAYFVPDRALLVALESAALRGVDVRLLLPGHSNHPLVQMCGRSYYGELIESGCRIYEYLPGMLHAKSMVVDGRWATIGSANMDMRSFRLNFEVNVAIYDEAFAARLERIFAEDLTYTRVISERQPGTMVKLAEGACRILAPLL